MGTHIVDRRSNPGKKSLPNRQRFLQRAKAQIARKVREATGAGKIEGVTSGGPLEILLDGVEEPRLRKEGGIRNIILPGNKKYSEGEYLSRPKEKSGKSGGSGDGDSEDSFKFILSREEYIDMFLDDLELPELTKKTLVGSPATKPRRAGYTMTGSPTSMAVPKTVIRGIARRIALRGATKKKIEELETELLTCADDERRLYIEQELEKCRQRIERIAFIDPLDIRYRRFEQEPTPIAQAVMFCLMDVSGSMSEHMKDLAKRFYILLYIFLKRRYGKVELVFIRHTEIAEEVDEETFFYGPASGGTAVSSVLEVMFDVVKKRFDPAHWNIYAAQSSDGDNTLSDESKVRGLMTDTILPLVQYFAYIEVAEKGGKEYMSVLNTGESQLWKTYSDMYAKGAPINMRKVDDRQNIYPVFRELFEKKGHKHAQNA